MTTDLLTPPAMPKAGAICYAAATDVLLYKASPHVGAHLPGVRDVALWSTDQLRARDTHWQSIVAALIERAEKAEADAEYQKLMPLMRTGFYVHFDVLDERQAQRNHGQTLARLRERGGLGPSEALAIAERRSWRQTNIPEAITALSALAAAKGAA